jgi:hypothetical protein
VSKTNVTTPTHSTATLAPDYAVPDPQESWGRFNRLVDKVLEPHKFRANIDTTTKMVEQNISCHLDEKTKF